MNHRALTTVLAACTLALAACDEGPRNAISSTELAVSGSDAVTGKHVSTVCFSVVSQQGHVIERNCRGSRQGKTPHNVGDEVILFAPGYDAQRQKIAATSLRRMTVTLRPSIGRLSLSHKEEGALAKRLHAVTKYFVPDPAGGNRSLFLHELRVTLGSGVASVPIPKGIRSVVYPKGALTDHVYPMVLYPKPTETSVLLSVERMRDVPIRMEGGRSYPQPFMSYAVPTYSTPSRWSPERVDALVRRLSGGLVVLSKTEGYVVNYVPPIDFHLFTQMGQDLVYQWVPASASQIVIPNQREKSTLSGDCMVGGAKAPHDSLIAPGRLGLNALASLRRMTQARFVLGPDRPGAGKRGLAAASTYTVWSPSRGFAYGAISGGRVVAPEWESGKIIVRARSRAHLSGTCSIWQELRGTGIPISGFLEDIWTTRAKGVPEIAIRGVPPGRYRLNLDLELGNGERKVKVRNEAASPIVDVLPGDSEVVVWLDE